MEKFEERLANLKIPEIEDISLKYELRDKIQNKYFRKTYHNSFRFALSSAFLFLILSMVLVIKPSLASKANNLVMGENSPKTEVTKSVESDNNEQINGFEGLSAIAKNKMETQKDKQYNVVNNNNIQTINSINPDDFEEGKIYMIRKIQRENSDGIILINEIESNNNRKVIRKM